MRSSCLALAVAALLAGPTTAAAPPRALSVDFNTLWSVDLETHAAQQLDALDSVHPTFSCAHLTESTAGELRCSHQGSLYAVEPGTLRLVSDLPASSGPYTGLSFDAADRLWYVTGDSAILWQLDPDTGAVIHSIPLSLAGSQPGALAAFGDRLFLFTQAPNATFLEEVDSATGVSLSSVDVRPCDVFDLVVDAAFDERGTLWSAQSEGNIINDVHCYRYHRYTLEPFTCSSSWSGCLNIHLEPKLVNLAAPTPRGSIVDIPTVGSAGLVIVTSLLAAIALLRLRRSVA